MPGESNWIRSFSIRMAVTRRCSITARYSLPLGPVQHCVEAIDEAASIARIGYIVEKIGESERILAHAVQQRFETSSSGALVAPTEGSTKPVSVVVTNAGVATVEQYDLRMP